MDTVKIHKKHNPPCLSKAQNLLLALRVGGWQFVCFETVFYWYHLVYLISDGREFISVTSWGHFFSHILLVETNHNYSFAHSWKSFITLIIKHCHIQAPIFIPWNWSLLSRITTNQWWGRRRWRRWWWRWWYRQGCGSNQWLLGVFHFQLSSLLCSASHSPDWTMSLIILLMEHSSTAGSNIYSLWKLEEADTITVAFL